MKDRPILTRTKIERLRKALSAVAETDEVNQPHYVDPRAHEVRAEISRAFGIPATLEAILESRARRNRK
jgi:hypothetical protein